MDDDETRLHRTAVARVFAFILQALRSRPPPESWHDKADRLGTWAVEYEQILQSSPEEERKDKKPRVSLYKPRRWKGFERSPIRTRSKSTCQRPDDGDNHTDDEDPPSPSPHPRSGKSAADPVVNMNRGDRGGKRQEQSSTTKQNIQTRPFCTQSCLKGLAYGGPMDDSCPNREHHGQEHIERRTFLRLVRDQLARDRGRDADCMSMNLAGARGALFKVRLSSHGYTLVAKGMESVDLRLLQHENAMYDRLVDIQGIHIPVCLGNIELVRPCHYDGGVNIHFMFLGWAGRPLFECINRLDEVTVIDGVTRIFKALHNLGALHRDAELRNILCDENGKLMAVDLERAEYRGRQPLGQVSPNRKKKRKVSKPGRDEFAQELTHIVERCRRSLYGIV